MTEVFPKPQTSFPHSKKGRPFNNISTLVKGISTKILPIIVLRLKGHALSPTTHTDTNLYHHAMKNRWKKTLTSSPPVIPISISSQSFTAAIRCWKIEWSYDLIESWLKGYFSYPSLQIVLSSLVFTLIALKVHLPSPISFSHLLSTPSPFSS